MISELLSQALSVRCWRSTRTRTVFTGRMVVLIRPIFHRDFPLDEALKVRWIDLHFFFRSIYLYQESPSSTVLAGSRRWQSGPTKNSCSPSFNCAKWSCVPLGDSPG